MQKKGKLLPKNIDSQRLLSLRSKLYGNLEPIL